MMIQFTLEIKLFFRFFQKRWIATFLADDVRSTTERCKVNNVGGGGCVPVLYLTHYFVRSCHRDRCVCGDLYGECARDTAAVGAAMTSVYIP